MRWKLNKLFWINNVVRRYFWRGGHETWTRWQGSRNRFEAVDHSTIKSTFFFLEGEVGVVSTRAHALEFFSDQRLARQTHSDLRMIQPVCQHKSLCWHLRAVHPHTHSFSLSRQPWPVPTPPQTASATLRLRYARPPAQNRSYTHAHAGEGWQESAQGGGVFNLFAR